MALVVWPPVRSRTKPTKAATPPISLRPAVMRANSAPMSKSAACTRIISAARHRREEGDLVARCQALIELGEILVDRHADRLEIGQRLGMAAAAPAQQGHEILHRLDARRVDDLLADPG